jgi:predicted esterase
MTNLRACVGRGLLVLAIAAQAAAQSEPAPPAPAPAAQTPPAQTPPPPGGVLDRQVRPSTRGTGAEAPRGTWWTPRIAITRENIARAYQQLEQALADRPPEGATLERTHMLFDQLTFLFFRGQFGQAVQRVHELYDEVSGSPPGEDERLARSLAVQLDPPVWVVGSNEPVKVRVGSMYRVLREPAPGGEHAAAPADLTPIRWGLRLRPRVGTAGLPSAMIDWPITGEVGGPPRADDDGAAPAADNHAGQPVAPQPVAADATARGPLEVFAEGVITRREDFPTQPGVYRVQVIAGDLGTADVATFTIVDRSRAALREELRTRLEAAREKHPDLQHAVALAAGRLTLLTDSPSPDSSAEFLGDQVALGIDLQAEVARIEQGENPYRLFRVDHWRSVPIGTAAAGDAAGRSVPARVYAPPAVTRQNTEPARLFPLVIALHGAGGDENMFFDAYGSGRIKRLADERGFVVVAPRTEAIATVPGALEALLDSIRADYPIDPERIYVLGHSMGGFVAGSLADRLPERIAAAACLAGGPRGALKAPAAPMLVIGATLDTVIPAGTLEQSSRKYRGEGLDIEYREKPGMGHTLMVGECLPEAIDWLLARRLAAPNKPIPAPPLVPAKPASQQAPANPASAPGQ